MRKVILLAPFLIQCTFCLGAPDLRREARELFDQRNYYAAVEAAAEAVNFYRDDAILAEMYLLRGQAHQKRRNLNLAFADFEVAYSINPEATRTIAAYGNALAAGYSGELDWEKGAELLRAAADLNDSVAQYQLAINHLIRRSATKKVFLDLLEKAAAQDHKEALLRLAQFYQYGQYVDKDWQRSLHYYRILSALNHPEGQYYLALAFYSGTGVERDLDKFQRLIKLAASQWHLIALNAQGNELSDKQDLKATNFFFRAAAFNYAPAQVNLGNAYLRGFGVDQNFKQARYWFLKARRTRRAQEFLGILSLLGLGVEQNMETAFLYFKQSSGLGGERISHLSYSQLAVLSQLGVGDLRNDFYDQWQQQLASLDDTSNLNSIVWSLSTNPIAELNRPEIALRLAIRLQEKTDEPAYLDSVAAALAINGEFRKAKKIQKKVLSALAGSRELPAAKQRYKGYKRKTAWVEDYKQFMTSRPSETRRTIAIFTGEIIRPDTNRRDTAPAFRIGLEAHLGVPILIKDVIEGSLPYTMREYAYFLVRSISGLGSGCGPQNLFTLPDGINTFTLKERLSANGWQYEFSMSCNASKPRPELQNAMIPGSAYFVNKSPCQGGGGINSLVGNSHLRGTHPADSVQDTHCASGTRDQTHGNLRKLEKTVLSRANMFGE